MRFRDGDWVYEKLTKHSGGEELPRVLWDTWRNARNLVFHWFPEEKNAVNLTEAEEKVRMIVVAMDMVSKNGKQKNSKV
jgi:hypothetical protein